MKAILKNNVSGEEIEVIAMTEHPDSSYGKDVWVDETGVSYCQVGMESPFYTVLIKCDNEDGAV